MISVEEALEKVLDSVRPLEPESMPILDAAGQVLAEDVRSEVDVPPWDNSAMDGYAVRSGDTAGASRATPRVLRVIGTVIAGAMPAESITPGTAIRIMTGAPLPAGADAVVQFENTDEADRRSGRATAEIGILEEADPRLNVRDAGEDIRAGSLVLRNGMVLRPAEIGVLASVGRARARVIRRPVVAVLSTGNELVEVGQLLPAGKIYNSNLYSIAALVKRCGAIPQLLGIARDSVDSVAGAVGRGLNADMLITSGGVSAGDYDMVKNVLSTEGEIGFWTVRMKPGKPLAFGTIRRERRAVPLLGLPGNPVSSMVTFELFARPAIMKMMGLADFSRPVVQAELFGGRITNRDGRRVYSRAVVTRRGERYVARLAGPQGSGQLTSMSRANALLVLPEDRNEARAGDTLAAIMLDWSQSVETEPESR